MCPEAVIQDSGIVNKDGPATWAWLAIAIVVIGIDLLLFALGYSTLSQRILHFAHGKPWLQWLGVALFTILGFHLFFGGPLWTLSLLLPMLSPLLPKAGWRGLRHFLPTSGRKLRRLRLTSGSPFRTR